MFTPQEVSEKVFPKASFGGGGYNMASVDEFLDALTEDYTALFKENVTLKAKLKVLAEKVEEYRSTEEVMRQALLMGDGNIAIIVSRPISATIIGVASLVVAYTVYSYFKTGRTRQFSRPDNA